jgi:hypothetical protein
MQSWGLSVPQWWFVRCNCICSPQLRPKSEDMTKRFWLSGNPIGRVFRWNRFFRLGFMIAVEVGTGEMPCGKHLAYS